MTSRFIEANSPVSDGTGRCKKCNDLLADKCKTPFEYRDGKYCSMHCVMQESLDWGVDSIAEMTKDIQDNLKI